jgi:hypothetical protein
MAAAAPVQGERFSAMMTAPAAAEISPVLPDAAPAASQPVEMWDATPVPADGVMSAAPAIDRGLAEDESARRMSAHRSQQRRMTVLKRLLVLSLLIAGGYALYATGAIAKGIDAVRDRVSDDGATPSGEPVAADGPSGTDAPGPGEDGTAPSTPIEGGAAEAPALLDELEAQGATDSFTLDGISFGWPSSTVTPAGFTGFACTSPSGAECVQFRRTPTIDGPAGLTAESAVQVQRFRKGLGDAAFEKRAAAAALALIHESGFPAFDGSLLPDEPGRTFEVLSNPGQIALRIRITGEGRYLFITMVKAPAEASDPDSGLLPSPGSATFPG